MQQTSFSVPKHPLGVKPAGNIYTVATKTASGPIQRPWEQLPDELVVQILEFLDAKSLLRLGSTCKTFFAFSRLEELWKGIYIQSPSSSDPTSKWRGTWYTSYADIPSANLAKVDVTGLASDVLYRPFLCAHTPLEPYTTNIPPRNAITRLPDLTAEEFAVRWTDQPFILTQPVTRWPAFRNWDESTLLEKYANTVFRAEAVDWPLRKYLEYMNDNSDESPLYLFDRSFVEKMGIEVGGTGEAQGYREYWPPACFGSDLFAALGAQRPDSRWLIVGPARSGSTFHKDPNATSAWNAVLRGSKYWIMFPPSSSSSPPQPPPPGVYVSADHSEVTSPLSIAEWLLSFHAEARHTPGCVEAVCRAGELLHVPSGWWHLVVNLEESNIAVTQNFVPRAHLTRALAFLRDRPEQVSGFDAEEVRDPYALFRKRLGEKDPHLLAQALAEMEEMGVGAGGRSNGKLKVKNKRKWDELVNGHGGQETEKEDGARKSNGFSFGFGSGGEDDDADIP